MNNSATENRNIDIAINDKFSSPIVSGRLSRIINERIVKTKPKIILEKRLIYKNVNVIANMKANKMVSNCGSVSKTKSESASLTKLVCLLS